VEKVITLEDVCSMLHITAGTGRNRLSRGSDMPPSFRAGRRRLFLCSAVEAWLLDRANTSHSTGSAAPPPAQVK
jgi:hypothetical protein